MARTDLVANAETMCGLDGIVESNYKGLVVLSPVNQRPVRRILFVNCYGGSSTWEEIKRGEMPGHHLWGCIELVRMGYEIALAEPLPDFNRFRKQLPHDLVLLGSIRSWLRRDDLIYCGHNVLFWIPLLASLSITRRKIVSLLYAREPLRFSATHAGILALNPAAETHARSLAPGVKVAHVGWGADLPFFPAIPYNPRWHLSCGVTFRDHKTLSEAAALSGDEVHFVAAKPPAGVDWPRNVKFIGAGSSGSRIPFQNLLNEQYGPASTSLVITCNDPTENGACGFTNMLEAMAMGRPIITTRTGSLLSEIDVEREGCGIYVPPGDVGALAKAMESLRNDPDRAAAMGLTGRRLCESHYNINRYATDLDAFFSSL